MDTISSQESSVRTASLGIRFVAFIVDMLVIGTVLFVARMMIELIFGYVNTQYSSGVGAILGWVYFVGFHQSVYQATPGKMLLQIVVVRSEDGRRISALRALLRHAVLYAGALLSMIVAVSQGEPLFGPSIVALKPSAQLPTFGSSRTNAMEDEDKLKDIYLQKAYEEINRKLYDKEPLTTREEELLKALQRNQLLGMFSPNRRGMVKIGAWIYGLVSMLMIGFTAQHTGIHDLAAKTLVIKRRYALW